MYGFRKIKNGGKQICYKHPMFIRSKPEIAGYIVRKPEKKGCSNKENNDLNSQLVSINLDINEKKKKNSEEQDKE